MSATSERPTVLPTFDVEKFARESDDRIVAVAPLTAPAAPVDPDEPLLTLEELDPVEEALLEATSEVRIAARPELGDFLGLETWARGASGALAVTMSLSSIRNLPLDNRAGFLLSLMDGTLDLETLVEISCLDRDTVLRIVRDLHESGVVAFR